MGKPATLEVAASKAAAILREARQPVLDFGWNGCGRHAVHCLSLPSERAESSITSPATPWMRNSWYSQDGGLDPVPRLTEVRNRADLLIVARHRHPAAAFRVSSSGSSVSFDLAIHNRRARDLLPRCHAG